MMNALGRGYCYFAQATNYLQSPLLLIIRLYWGWHFILSGIGKFGNIPSVVQFFESINIPAPLFHAYLVASIETIGGFLLFVGLFSRLAALLLTSTMTVAYWTAHKDAVLDIWNDSESFISADPFLYLYAALIVLAFGAGVFSLDYLMQRRHRKTKES